MKLEGKVAVVTGAASGIGLATAERLVSDGASVVALDVANAPTAGRWDIGPVDVSNADQVERAVARIVEHHARIDVLVNNAGINIGGKVAEMGLHEWNEVIAVDLTGVFLCSKYVITHMEQQGGGVIVNVASQLGMVGFPAFAAYNAAKGGLVNLTRNMALDYADANIRVNAVCPGPVDTPHIAQHFASLSPEECSRAYRELAELVPLKRLARPEEIAACIAFLASDDASYVTGSLLVVDGGYTAR